MRGLTFKKKTQNQTKGVHFTTGEHNTAADRSSWGGAVGGESEGGIFC